MTSEINLDNMIATIQSVVGKLQTILRFTQDYPEQSSSSLQRATLGSLKEAQELQTLFFQSNGNDGYEDWEDLEIMADKLFKKLPNDYLKQLQEQNDNNNSSISGDGWHRTRYDKEQKFLKDLRYDGLLNIVSNIRKLESTFSFQSMLWHDKHQIAKDLNTPPEQFTYGSSLFKLWYSLFEHKSFLHRIHKSKNNNSKKNNDKKKKQVVIFGSSQGLLAAYLAMHHVLRHNEHRDDGNENDECNSECNLDIRGYEVLPTLHKLAIETSLKVELELKLENSKSSSSKSKAHRSAKCIPLLQDMMTADLHQCDVLILCSLCWDTSTKEAVAKKALLELPKGSLVVDFTCDTFDYDINNDNDDTSSSPPSISKEGKGEQVKDESWSLLLDSALTQVSVVSVSDEANTNTNKYDSIRKSKQKKKRKEKEKKKKHKPRCLRTAKLEGFIAGPTSWSDEQSLCLFGIA